MTEYLPPLLRVAGAGLIGLALAHWPIARRLRWGEEAARLSPANADVFKVHAFFICVVLVAMGLPCLLEPSVLLERSRAGLWGSWLLAGFWGLRLVFQWFVYRAELWRGKPFETAMHWLFTGVWTGLTSVFALCGAAQCGWVK